MSGPRREKRRSLRWVLVCAIVLPIAYTISIGPAFWLYWHGYASMSTVRMLYAPVFWVYKNSESLGRYIDWYLQFWSPL